MLILRFFKYYVF